jgi:hypothetical protein
MKERITSQRAWERVKEALEDAGLPSTQKHAAQLVGISQASVAGWNVAGNGLSIESAKKLSEATGVAVEWLITGRGPKYIGPPNDQLALELWRLWSHLSEGIKGRIVGIAGEHAVYPQATPQSAPTEGTGRVLRFTPKHDDGPTRN